MNSSEVKWLMAEMPEDMVSLLKAIYEVKLILEKIHKMPLPDYKLNPILSENMMYLNMAFKKFGTVYLELLRKHIQEYDLPEILPFRETEEGKSRVTLPQGMNVNLYYRKALLDDYRDVVKSVNMLENKETFLKNTSLIIAYLSTIEYFIDFILETIVRAKKEWYRQLKLLPDREKNRHMIMNAIFYRLNALNTASEKILYYLRSVPCKKKYEVLEKMFYAIANTYKTRVYELVQDEALIASFHSSDEFIPLNTVLDLAYKSFKGESIKGVKPLSVLEGLSLGFPEMENEIQKLTLFEHIEVQNRIDEFNEFIGIPLLQQSQVLLKYATEDPWGIEEKFTLNDRKEYLTRPNEEDFELLWQLFIESLLLGVGHAIPLKEEEKKAI